MTEPTFKIRAVRVEATEAERRRAIAKALAVVLRHREKGAADGRV